MGKLFGTDGVRDKANQGSMTAETTLKLGRAVALYFREGHADDEVRPTIVIGRDPRLSGSMLEAALADVQPQTAYEWRECLDALQEAKNSLLSVSEVSPMQLVFGRNPEILDALYGEETYK